MPFSIDREIAQIRNRQRDNWLAQALEKIQQQVNQIQAPSTASTPSATAPALALIQEPTQPATKPAPPPNPFKKKQSNLTVITSTGRPVENYTLQLGSSGLPIINHSDLQHQQKMIDTIPDGSVRMGPTIVRMDAATDIVGNLLLKNVVDTPGTTSNPTNGSASPVTSDLSATVTTKGNPILLTMSFSFSNSTSGGSVFFQFYRDGLAVGSQAFGASPTVGQNMSCSLSYVDHPAAGSHTYAVYWWTTSGTTSTGNGTNRGMQIVELG